MNITEIKNIVGEAKPGEVATIRFFSKINEESTTQFNNEFDYLENVVRPSLIRVLINSEGGSVLHGMTTYSTIQNSKIPTECVIEGMAASMASIIWAAGNKSLMRDYSILMIHNPFLPSNEEANASDLVLAFIKQIKTIYHKRFGLSESHIEGIMNGEVGKDGTFFDADSAIKAGIIPNDNIIHTSPQLCKKVKNKLFSIENITDIQTMMSEICMEIGDPLPENKLLSQTSPIHNQTHQNINQMKEGNTNIHEYSAVAASLGFKENFEVKDVMGRITELLGVEAKLTETGKALKDAQTVIAGKDAAILNLQKDNADLNVSLEKYRKKEEDESNAKIEQMVEAAITDGKIDKASKGQWVDMAKSNFALAENTLASIPVRDQITKEIATDPDNVKKSVETAKNEEIKLTEKVSAVVGAEFKFKTLG